MASFAGPIYEEDSYDDEGDVSFSEDEEMSGYDTDSLSEGTSDEDSEACGARGTETKHQPCKYYNESKCKDRNCTYLHVCKYYLKGNCKYGSKCKLSHRITYDTESSSSLDQDRQTKTRRRPEGKNYQWQVNDGQGWNDIKSDYIIEAQYSLPGAKGIKLYNSRYGKIAIDFNKMKVCGKDLQVQRKNFPSSPNKDEWLWYYRCNHKWKQFSAKDNAIRSADIENQYKLKMHNFIQISLNQKSYKICFREMVQINVATGTKRRLRRRPKFRSRGKGSCSVSESLRQLDISGQQSTWQFEGKHGVWYDFKTRSGTDTECSVTSREIESEYEQNQQGCMTFYVNDTKFQLDFSAMTQTNLSTGAIRNVRRILVSP
ncbi:protein mono-ADP-ribosyltransferase PARP12 [Heptranchias perlo]|uniref:protein mono-ADP-ribosyltransferase PARP12 n=1 Tax=Heptranchias perlo TaxID=212740 RepID=UPI00355AB2F1